MVPPLDQVESVNVHRFSGSDFNMRGLPDLDRFHKEFLAPLLAPEEIKKRKDAVAAAGKALKTATLVEEQAGKAVEAGKVEVENAATALALAKKSLAQQEATRQKKVLAAASATALLKEAEKALATSAAAVGAEQARAAFAASLVLLLPPGEMQAAPALPVVIQSAGHEEEPSAKRPKTRQVV